MPRVPSKAIRTVGGRYRRAALVASESVAANFFGAGLLTGSKLNQLAMYASSTRCRLIMSRRFAITPRQLRSRSEKACSEVCSHLTQEQITTRPLAVLQ